MTGTAHTSEQAVHTVGRPVHTRIQVFGLGLVGTTMLAVSLVAIVSAPSEAGEVLIFFGPFIVLTLLAAWLAWRFGRWAQILGLVISLLAGLGAFWTAFGLMAPDSVLDFTLGLGVPLGTFLGLGGGIAALRSRRRGRFLTSATEFERRLVKGATGLVVVGIAASFVFTQLARQTIDPAELAGATGVEMAHFAFDPDPIVLPAGDVRLAVSNADVTVHDIHIPDLDDEVFRVTPGSAVLAEWSNVGPGTYTVYCTLHSRVGDPSDRDMVATLVVR